MATSRVQLIQDVLGSAHIFSSAVNDLMQERLHAIISEQLTFSQIKLLKLIARSGTYNISQVASFLAVSSAAASKAVDRLVRRNLLRRTEAESDRRAVEVALTSEGKRVLGEYERVTNQVLEEIFGAVPPEGLREIAEHLDHLSIRLVNHEGGKDEACFRCGIYFRDKCLLRSEAHRLCHFHLSARDGEPTSQDGDGDNGSRRDPAEM
jgi:DNA-binding MarR family transcriptional regulator